MPFITPEDLATHIYPEGMDTISRDDDSKVQDAIDSAMTQVAPFLSRYDTDAIFATEGEDRKPYAGLITYIKDIAKWDFIAVANVTVDYEVAKERYDRAIKALREISKSVMEGWPLKEPDYEKSIAYGSRPKFDHGF